MEANHINTDQTVLMEQSDLGPYCCVLPNMYHQKTKQATIIVNGGKRFNLDKKHQINECSLPNIKIT